MNFRICRTQMNDAEEEFAFADPMAFLQGRRHDLHDQVRPREYLFRGKRDRSSGLPVRFHRKAATERPHRIGQ